MTRPEPEGIRLITFDVGGTLIHAHPSVGAIYSEVLGRRGFRTSPEEVSAAFESAWEEASAACPPGRERYTASPDGERGYWRRLLSGTVSRLGGAEPPPGAADELFERFGHRGAWRVYPDVVETLEALASQGLQLGVVSNWDSRLPGLLRELGLRGFFGPIAVSALEGCEKPSPRIFQAVAERAGVEVGQMLHVGDRRSEDGDGAKSAGARSLLVDRSGADASDGLKRVYSCLDRARPALRGAPA
ncbi:MAG TPA: HAD-IA family hydrolase [Candidatus Polarisedimenticolia bacterium]|nr:HAD-IA family hydrolase [Candidatus Polarisedimenticolia bacterium]